MLSSYSLCARPGWPSPHCWLLYRLHCTVVVKVSLWHSRCHNEYRLSHLLLQLIMMLAPFIKVLDSTEWCSSEAVQHMSRNGVNLAELSENGARLILDWCITL